MRQTLLTESNNRYFEAKQAQMSQTSVTSRSNVTGQNESDEAAGQSHNSWHRTQCAPSLKELTSCKVHIANASSGPKPPQGWCQHRMAVSAAHVCLGPVKSPGGLVMVDSVSALKHHSSEQLLANLKLSQEVL